MARSRFAQHDPSGRHGNALSHGDNMATHANLEMSKSDAAELAALAKGLREELDKPNVDVLSLEVMNRIDKIEKLAKKIREETKGF